MKPRLTISDDKVYVSHDHLCNGHWMVFKRYVRNQKAPKALRRLLLLKPGAYLAGRNRFAELEYTVPDLDTLVPMEREGYFKIDPEPRGVTFNHDEIQGYRFNVVDGCQVKFHIHVKPRYVPILRMGTAFAKSSSDPILILDGEAKTDVVMAIVMPLRQ